MNEELAVVPHDRTLRVVMWLDAFWSVAFVLVALLALPLTVALDVPSGARLVLGIAAVVLGGFLALCGAVTGALLMARMQHGHYGLPDGLRVPLPAFMRPGLLGPRR